MYGVGVSILIIPFIALCILSVMVDRLIMVLEEIAKKIPWLPINKFWGPLAYLIVFAAGYLVCWMGNFDFFTSLGFTFQHPYEGWSMTALLLSGGSAFVKSAFGMVNSIPQIVSNVFSTVTNFVTGGGTTDPTIAPEPLAQEETP
jgi:hypothetical protein